MGDRGWLSGAAMHSEYHTVERKKKKAANCKYLTNSRMCKNEKSPCYLAKCFEATWCTYRVKEKQVPSEKQQENPIASTNNKKNQDKYKGIKCSLPMGIEITNKKKSKGKLVKYNKEKRFIYVKYPEKEDLVKYIYPEVFLDGFLTVNENFNECIARDITSRR